MAKPRIFFGKGLSGSRKKWYDSAMSVQKATMAYLLDQCERYPALEPADLLKGLHQSVFGCGHFVTDRAAGLALLRRELEVVPND